MTAIPGGPFVHGGLGEPPGPYRADELSPETTVTLPLYFVDQTEVTQASFDAFAAMSQVTGIVAPTDPAVAEFKDASPRYPIAGLTWLEARAYCRFLGKDLPTNEQWEKALRGGLVLPDGTTNPSPRRNLPWGPWTEPVPANLADTSGHPKPVGMAAGDRGPYGTLDLAGNVQEWTRTKSDQENFRVVRGADWDVKSDDLLTFMPVRNPRPVDTRDFRIGMRCVLEP
jgi:formylglycine-generating enzyme required for sulfatase activity